MISINLKFDKVRSLGQGYKCIYWYWQN